MGAIRSTMTAIVICIGVSACENSHDPAKTAEKTAVASLEHPYAGFWKQGACNDNFGLAVAPAGPGMYSVSFCGPGGCFRPGTYRPNTTLVGDSNYRIRGPDVIEVGGYDGFSKYVRCGKPAEAAPEEPQISLFRALNSNKCDLAEQIVADASEADALLYEAVLHDLGKCAAHDEILADTLYLRAAKAGNAEAMYSVWARMAERVGGPNAPTDAERAAALNWLLRAGELGNWRAAHTLWQFYQYALYGYEQDEEKATYWKKVYELNRPPTKKP
jgi:hypothetical protein